MGYGTKSKLRARHWLIGMLVGFTALAACGGSGDDQASSGSGGPADGGGETADNTAENTAGNTVTMELIAFKPANISVSVGDTVTWDNQEAASIHTVTSGAVEQEASGVSATPDDLFESGDLGPGDTFEFTFDEPGTYAYYCAIHPATMTGEVSVAAE